MSSNACNCSGASDQQSIVGLASATPFGFFEDGISLWSYLILILVYTASQLFMAWMARLLDRTEDEAMSYPRETKARYMKALQFAGYTLVSRVIQLVAILQISRPNWVLILALGVGAVSGEFVAMAFMERAQENQADTLSDLKSNLLKLLHKDETLRSEINEIIDYHNHNHNRQHQHQHHNDRHRHVHVNDDQS